MSRDTDPQPQPHTHTQDAGGPASLHTYMSLPPTAYSALDPSNITRCPSSRDGAAFRLRVPRAQLLSVYLEPTVTVNVAGVPAPDGKDGLAAVNLTSTRCELQGSPLVASLRIDERFALSFDATLTWRAASGPSGGPASLTADITSLDVWAEPVGPFVLIPRSALAAAGDALLSRLLALLLPSFLSLLADDYVRWSTDAAYRAARSGVEEAVGAAR